MNTLFFAVLPYIAVVLAVVLGLYRYSRYRYTFSSLSNQLLENRALFWGSVSWHYGIILILLAHLIAAIVPGAWMLLLGGPIRLFVMETLGIGLALYTLAGLLILIGRRALVRAANATTSSMDWLLLVLLAAQVGSGLGIAVFRRWGSLWFLTNAVPWLWSVFSLQPDVTLVLPLPLLVKFHIATGFILILAFPFTRLVHIFTIPFGYLWRPYQLVVWNEAPPREKEA